LRLSSTAHRHDENQQAAERIAAKVAPFPFSWGPARTLTITEGMALVVIRRALDQGLIVPIEGEAT
jgi:hypothetical protein